MGAVEHREFDHPSGQLVRMIRLAQTAMSCATAAVLDADLDVGDSLSAAAKALHAARWGFARLPLNARPLPAARVVGPGTLGTSVGG